MGSSRVQRDDVPLDRDVDSLASSPSAPLASPKSRKSTKLRKPPPITPKRFTRFFTPRSSASITSRSSTARQLKDITKSVVNRSSSRLRLKISASLVHGNENAIASPASVRELPSGKRKHFVTPPTSPFYSSPSKRPRFRAPSFSMAKIPSSPPTLPVVFEDQDEDGDTVIVMQTNSQCENDSVQEVTFCQPVRRLRAGNTSVRVLERSFGGLETQGRGFRTDVCVSSDDATRDFITTEDDLHRHKRRALTFGVTACNTADLAAIATETGQIHFVDTSEGGRFDKCHIMIKPLDNAIPDLVFSSDDSTLAIACGDRSMRLIDMQTQKTKMVFENHTGCVKQVRYRPDDDHVLATSCREGIVNLWDTRCKGDLRPVITEYTHGDSRHGASSIEQEYKVQFQSTPTRSWPSAHSDRLRGIEFHHKTALRDLGKGDVVFADKDISVTALTFLSPQRSHLLVTASEADASLRLWDIRSRSSRRTTGESIPISSTGMPSSHWRSRHYGITALATNTDASRIYAVSRDSTIYAYSTQHLVLGSVPEMLPSISATNRYATELRQGLGPLYGMKHPAMTISSFYVKACVRPARNNMSELFATGSSDGNALLFPTDERELKLRYKNAHPLTLDPSSATPVFDADSKHVTPIITCGTRLANGHNNKYEVCSLAWTRNGELISCSDDLRTRIWRENKELARTYRKQAQQLGASTSMIGFSDVPDNEDEEEP